MVQPPEMIEILRSEKDSESITHRLLEAALAAGGKDNATVICVCAEQRWMKKLLGKLRG